MDFAKIRVTEKKKFKNANIFENFFGYITRHYACHALLPKVQKTTIKKAIYYRVSYNKE